MSGRSTSRSISLQYRLSLDMTRLLWRSLFVAFAVFTLVVALSSPGKAQTLSDGLAVHYPFDGNPNDVSGNGNDGMLNGDPTFSAGVDGQAIRLDGNGDYTISGSSSTLEINNTLTVSAWIYPRTGSLTSPEGCIPIIV